MTMNLTENQGNSLRQVGWTLPLLKGSSNICMEFKAPQELNPIVYLNHHNGGDFLYFCRLRRLQVSVMGDFIWARGICQASTMIYRQSPILQNFMKIQECLNNFDKTGFEWISLNVVFIMKMELFLHIYTFIYLIFTCHDDCFI